jgi:hypothetical protein
MSGISWRWFCNFKTQDEGDFEFWIINFGSFLSLEIDCLGGRWIIRYRNDKVARFHHPSCFQQHKNLVEVGLHYLPQIPGKMKSAPIANSFTAWHSGIWCKQKLGNLVDFVRGGMPFSLALCKQKSHQLLLCPLHCHMVLTQSKRKDLQSGQVSNKTDLEQCATNRERQCLQHGWSSPTRLMSRFTDLLWNLFSGC